MYRETTISVDGEQRVIRTEGANAKKLEAAHTKTVQAALIEMRTAAMPDTMPREMAERLAKRATQFPGCAWKSVTRKLPALPARKLSDNMTEVAPDRWVENG